MPTIKQQEVAKKILENPGMPIGQAMVEAGYSEAMAKNPQDLTESKGWQELMEEHLSLDKLARKHDRLLNAHKLEHMVFPPERSAEEEEEPQPHGGSLKRQRAPKDRAVLSDQDITDMLAEVGCTVRKIVHGEMARHVYFWSPDNNTQQKVLDMAYKLTGSYAPEKHVSLNLKAQTSLTADEIAKLKANVKAKQTGSQLP